jgi:UDP-2,3-diacylglucosamine pyrophosphatase LpxH
MTAASVHRRRLVIVSDLHMATADGPLGDPFAEDEAFAGLLGALASDGPPTRLVLLGDTFDLVLADGGGLDAIAAAHPAVFHALGGFVRSGHTVEVVPGNHDIDLMERPVQERLRELVGAAVGDRNAGARIGFRPWIVYVPGVLYAEHGQQHHDLNHFKSVPSGPDDAGGGALPPGLCLDQARVRLAGLRRRRPAATAAVQGAALAGGIARAGASVLRTGGPWSRRRRERRLRDHALELGLPAEALVEIDRRATPTPLSIAGRMARRAAQAQSPEPMSAAARTVCEILADTGATIAFCVFGHTHIAADRRVGEHPSAPRYLNAGTWSTMVRRGRDGAEDRLHWVEIEHGGGPSPTARLRHWESPR